MKASTLLVLLSLGACKSEDDPGKNTDTTTLSDTGSDTGSDTEIPADPDDITVCGNDLDEVDTGI